MHPIAPYARTAYATGWAASGGPLTDRVKAGCAAAVDLAIQHADDPGILEATLKLGSLEGVWAAIYERRQQLYDANVAGASQAWNELVAGLDLEGLVNVVRRHVGLAETYDEPDDDDEDVRDGGGQDQARQVSLEYVVGLVLLLLRAKSTAMAWLSLRYAIQQALASGTAEGQVGALALLAEQIGRVGFDFAKAFTDARSQLGANSPVLASADQWLEMLAIAVANDIAKQLAAGIAAGKTRRQIIDDLANRLGTNYQVLVSVIDQLTHMAITAGIFSTYHANGVAQVWFITAGDERVCPTCDALEQDSPYPIADAPQPPIHPNCRCTVYTDDSLPSSLVDGYSG